MDRVTLLLKYMCMHIHMKLNVHLVIGVHLWALKY